MSKLIEEYNVCEDCFFAIAEMELDFLDYYYVEKADDRRKEIERGIEKLSKDGELYPGDEEDEFSCRPYGCCKISLAGKRYNVVKLG